MRYILEKPYCLRGWKGSSTGLYHAEKHAAIFLTRDRYRLLLRCDGVYEFVPENLQDEENAFLREMQEAGVIRPAWIGEIRLPEQEYRVFPCRFRENAEWSVTGACNLRCRHCFMSAPEARHGIPSLQELKSTADQLAECGIFSVDITGGEPLTRKDFPQILDLLKERGIGVRTLLTNGWLVDDALLDALEERGFHPEFQMSFDGVGWHDFLRGIPGAEERTLNAFRCLQKRNFRSSAAMVLHRKNRNTLRDTALLLSSLGVSILKCGAAMELGEWVQPEVRDLRISRREELEIYEQYIPQYFEDGAPLGINLSGAFSYTPGESTWEDRGNRTVQETDLSCGTIFRCIFIGADGVVAPCMGMAESEAAGQLPSLHSEKLCDILNNPDFNRLCSVAVRDIREAHPECRSCGYAGQCDGGCRFRAVLCGNGYYGIDPGKCVFFRDGWSERIRAAAQPALEEYLKKKATAAE